VCEPWEGLVVVDSDVVVVVVVGCAGSCVDSRFAGSLERALSNASH